MLEQAIAKLKDKKVTPDLIIIPHTYRLNTEENNFQNSPLFKPQPLGLTTDGLSNYLIGTFDGIPVYAFYTDVLSNNILICNFSEAFTMRYKTSNDWYEEELKVQVTEVTDEQAEKRLKDEPDVWKKTDNGTDLTDQEALTLIKTSVNIEVYTTLDYVIKSTDAYVVGYVQSDSGKLSTL